VAVRGVDEDEEDDLVPATAVAGETTDLVILSPREFLEILAADAGNGGSAAGPT
jgi:hypothetical protein